MQCCLIAFYPEWNSPPQNWSQSSEILPKIWQLSLYNILHPNNLHSIFSRSIFHLKKSLSLLIHKKQLFIYSSSIMRLQKSVISSGSASNSSSLFISSTSAVTFSTKVLNSSMPFMRKGINFFWTPINADILTSSHTSHGSDGRESTYSSGAYGLILGWENPLEKEMAIRWRILAWRVPWTKEPGRL